MKRLATALLPLLAAAAVLVAGPQRETFDTVQLPKLAGLLLVASVVLARARPRVVDALDVCAAVVALLACLSAAGAYSGGATVRPLATLLGALALGSALRAQTDRSRWLATLTVAATLAALLGLGEATGLWQGALHGRAPASLFGQRNALAHVLVLALPIAWALAATAVRLRTRVAWSVCSVVLVAGIGVTRSRGAWLAVAACALGALALAWSSRQAKAPTLWRKLEGASASVAAFACTLLLPSARGWVSDHPYRDSFVRLVDSSSGSGAGRLHQWRHALELFALHPVLGVGPGNWRVAVPLVLPDAAHGHFINSDWVATLTERGALGALALLVAGVVLLWRWWKVDRTPTGAPLVTLVVLAVGVTGAFDSVTQLPAAALMLAIVCGAGLAPEAGTPVLPSGLARAGAVLCAALALAAVSSFASRLISSSDDISLERLEQAVQLDPLDADLRLTLSEAYVSARRCDDARTHLVALSRLLPFDKHAWELREVCARGL